jgi:hypothetical protein
LASVKSWSMGGDAGAEPTARHSKPIAVAILQICDVMMPPWVDASRSSAIRACARVRVNAHPTEPKQPR